MQFAYTFGHATGYQASPYRFVHVEGSPDFKVPETDPDTRYRHAFVVGLKRHLFKDSAIHLDYRFYIDNWGIMAHTGEVAYVVDLARRRNCDCANASTTNAPRRFFNRTTPTSRRYITADRELSTFWSRSGRHQADLQAAQMGARPRSGGKSRRLLFQLHRFCMAAESLRNERQRRPFNEVLTGARTAVSAPRSVIAIPAIPVTRAMVSKSTAESSSTSSSCDTGRCATQSSDVASTNPIQPRSAIRQRAARRSRAARPRGCASANVLPRLLEDGRRPPDRSRCPRASARRRPAPWRSTKSRYVSSPRRTPLLRRGALRRGIVSSRSCRAASPERRDVEVPLGREVVVEQALRDARRARQIVDRDLVVGALAEHREPEREELRAPLVDVEPGPRARAGRVRAGSAAGTASRGMAAGG